MITALHLPAVTGVRQPRYPRRLPGPEALRPRLSVGLPFSERRQYRLRPDRTLCTSSHSMGKTLRVTAARGTRTVVRGRMTRSSICCTPSAQTRSDRIENPFLGAVRSPGCVPGDEQDAQVRNCAEKHFDRKVEERAAERTSWTEHLVGYQDRSRHGSSGDGGAPENRGESADGHGEAVADVYQIDRYGDESSQQVSGGSPGMSETRGKYGDRRNQYQDKQGLA